MGYLIAGCLQAGLSTLFIVLLLNCNHLYVDRIVRDLPELKEEDGGGAHGTLAFVLPDMCNVVGVGVKTLLDCR